MTDATGTKQVPASTVAADSRSASPSNARRRLLLAAGAVLPSVYTLSSGAGTAAASNVVCLAKQGALPPRFTTEGDYTGRTDGWVRAPVSVGEYDGTPADCVTTPQSGCSDSAPGPSRPSSNSLAPAEASYSKAQDGSVWIVQGNRVISNSHVPITNVNPGRKHYGLVYVDETGTVSTLDPQGKPHLKPVTASCWASISGHTSKLG
jgi:hypothetical protein